MATFVLRRYTVSKVGAGRLELHADGCDIHQGDAFLTLATVNNATDWVDAATDLRTSAHWPAGRFVDVTCACLNRTVQKPEPTLNVELTHEMAAILCRETLRVDPGHASTAKRLISMKIVLRQELRQAGYSGRLFSYDPVDY